MEWDGCTPAMTTRANDLPGLIQKKEGAERLRQGTLLPKTLKSLYFLLKNKKNSRTYIKEGGAERLK